MRPKWTRAGRLVCLSTLARAPFRLTRCSPLRQGNGLPRRTIRALHNVFQRCSSMRQDVSNQLLQSINKIRAPAESFDSRDAKTSLSRCLCKAAFRAEALKATRVAARLTARTQLPWLIRRTSSPRRDEQSASWWVSRSFETSELCFCTWRFRPSARTARPLLTSREPG